MIKLRGGFRPQELYVRQVKTLGVRTKAGVLHRNVVDELELELNRRIGGEQRERIQQVVDSFVTSKLSDVKEPPWSTRRRTRRYESESRRIYSIGNDDLTLRTRRPLLHL